MARCCLTKSALLGTSTHSVGNPIVSDDLNCWTTLIDKYTFTPRKPNNNNGFLSVSPIMLRWCEANWASNIAVLISRFLSISFNLPCFWNNPGMFYWGVLGSNLLERILWSRELHRLQGALGARRELNRRRISVRLCLLLQPQCFYSVC